VWGPDYLHYNFGEHPMAPIRLDLTVSLSRSLGVLDHLAVIEPVTATESELLTVHSPDYLDAVRRASTDPSYLGHGLGSDDNPVFSGMFDAAALIAGGSKLAALQVWNGHTRHAVNIAGGLHHAMRDSAAGFCVINDVVVAIRALLEAGAQRVAYVDIDVHHGDGVQAAFYDDPRVLTISMHQHPRTLWPGTGYPRELGTGRAEGTSVNLPLPPGTTDRPWLRAFHAVVPSLLQAFEPEVLVSQCGVDTHRSDPLADLSLSVDGHAAAYRSMRDLAVQYAGGRWLALGGGGYDLVRVVPRSWTHLLATVLDRDVAPNRPLPADWVALAVGLVPPHVVLPTSMTDNAATDFEPWGGGVDDQVDVAIQETRRAVFPLHGLDPDDPRD
jgi:acetoin utilization protein AcuC